MIFSNLNDSVAIKIYNCCSFSVLQSQKTINPLIFTRSPSSTEISLDSPKLIMVGSQKELRFQIERQKYIKLLLGQEEKKQGPFNVEKKNVMKHPQHYPLHDRTFFLWCRRWLEEICCHVLWHIKLATAMTEKRVLPQQEKKRDIQGERGQPSYWKSQQWPNLTPG